MAYKVGDKVRIKDINWYTDNKHKNIDYDIGFECGGRFFNSIMADYCGAIMTIKKVFKNFNILTTYIMEEVDGPFEWSDEMIEGLECPGFRIDRSDDDKLSTEITKNGIKITSPDGYLIGKITDVVGGMMVEFVKK